MGLFRGAVLHHGGGARKQPISLSGPFPPPSMNRFSPLMGHCLEKALNRPVSLLKIPWKAEKALQENLD